MARRAQVQLQRQFAIRPEMLGIIRRHNQLNGVLFSVVEFALIAMLTGAFGAYYAIHWRAGMAGIALGITANCLAVVVVDARMWVDRTDANSHTSPLWNKTSRRQLRAENPHMLRDTLLRTTAALLPFVLLIAVM